MSSPEIVGIDIDRILPKIQNIVGGLEFFFVDQIETNRTEYESKSINVQSRVIHWLSFSSVGSFLIHIKSNVIEFDWMC